MKPFTFKLISFTLIFLTAVIGTGLQHESAHQEIWKDYDIDSELHFFLDIDTPFYVKANATQYFENCNETCRALQAQNEIAGYNVLSIVATILSIFALYFIFKEIDKMEDNLYVE